MRVAHLWLLAVTAAGSLALCQVPSPGGELRLVSEVRLVVLDVGVRDKSGKPVAGLGRGAFRIIDSGHWQPITNFAAEDAPVTIGLVVDTSGSMRTQRKETIAAASALIAGSRSDDEVFLATFNDDVAVGPPASPVALRRSIEEIRCEGRTALYDGIDAALHQLAKAKCERRALVIISDGGDTASRLSRSEVLDRVRRARVTIYAIGTTADLATQRDPGFLREVARASGGDAHLDVVPAKLSEVCGSVARDIRSRYMVGFHAAETTRTEVKSIRVVVVAPGGGRLQVISRSHYVARPSSQRAQP